VCCYQFNVYNELGFGNKQQEQMAGFVMIS
jgi:hypothetical protein